MTKQSWIVVICFVVLMCSSCVYNVTLQHTQGQASDLIDDNDTPTVDTKVDATLPVVP